MMKCKKDIHPDIVCKRGKHGTAICGGTLRKNLGYHAVISLFSALAVIFTLLTVGIIAFGKVWEGVKSAAEKNPGKRKAFFLAVSMLNKLAAELQNDAE